MNRDPISDMLTRMRNALQRRMATVDIPASNVCRGVLTVLRAEGFIESLDEIQDGRQGIIRIRLKYGPDGEEVVTQLKCESKPSRRVYKDATEVQPVLGGLGVGIYTTNQGILSDKQARHLKVGGELLCTVW